MNRWFWRRVVGQSKTGEQEEVSPGTDNQRIASEEVYLTATSRFLDLQMSTNDVFDNKTSSAFSIGSTVLPVTFGLLGLSSKQVSFTTIIILALALLAYLMLVLCVWRASRIRVLSYRPDMRTLQENSEKVPGIVLQRWVASEYVESTDFNTPKLDRKGRWAGWAVTSLYFEGFLLSLAAISTLR